MTRIRFEDLPSTNTPRNAENLNKLNNVVISPTEPTTGEEVWLEKGKNLFDKSSVLIGYGFSGTNGEVVVDATYYISDYIPIKENTSYYISGGKTSGMATIFYDKNKEYISGINVLTGVFETPPNACFVRVNGKISELNNNIQIVEGTQATEYEDFIRKIHIKNDNGVYEEFYNEEEHNKVNYSTEEQVIGTWINGKPIYRKIFKDLPLTTGNGVEVTAISNLDAVISLKGMVFHNIYGGQWKPANYYFSSSDYLTMVMSSAGRILVDNSSTSGTITIIVVYTKTTD